MLQKTITYDFSGKVALVTGSSRGIGFAVARLFLEAGGRVMVNGVNQGRLEAAVRQLAAPASQVAAFRADVSSASEVEAMFAALTEKWGRIDILVNNAMDRPTAQVVEMTEEQWDRNIDSCLKGTFLVSRLAARRMIDQGQGGKIVNVASGSWKIARVACSAYCAAKAGLVMFTAVLAQELGPHRINVNCVAPGLINVPRERVTEGNLSYQQATVSMTPWGRMGTPEDVAHLILMSCSEEADYMTGAVIGVDGGLSVGRYGIPVNVSV